MKLLNPQAISDAFTPDTHIAQQWQYILQHVAPVHDNLDIILADDLWKHNQLWKNALSEDEPFLQSLVDKGFDMEVSLHYGHVQLRNERKSIITNLICSVTIIKHDDTSHDTPNVIHKNATIECNNMDLYNHELILGSSMNYLVHYPKESSARIFTDWCLYHARNIKLSYHHIDYGELTFVSVPTSVTDSQPKRNPDKLSTVWYTGGPLVKPKKQPLPLPPTNYDCMLNQNTTQEGE